MWLRQAAREYVAAPSADFSKMFLVKADEKLETEWFRLCTHAKKAEFLNLVQGRSDSKFYIQDSVMQGLF
jgi:hypothetical protein